MSNKTFDELLESFNPRTTENASERKPGRPVTFWLTDADKARYDRLQKLSKGTKCPFSDIVKEAIITLIEKAEDRAA